MGAANRVPKPDCVQLILNTMTEKAALTLLPSTHGAIPPAVLGVFRF